MLRPRGDEHGIAGRERVPLAVVDQEPGAAHDDVDLVLRVRCLLVRPHRKRELEVEGAAAEDADGMLAGGAGNALPRSGAVEHGAAVAGGLAHAVAPMAAKTRARTARPAEISTARQATNQDASPAISAEEAGDAGSYTTVTDVPCRAWVDLRTLDWNRTGEPWG